MDRKIEIKNPCIEKWETMKIGINSRFCENCNKNVIDFTQKNKQEIIEYLLKNGNEKVCGRVYRSQLDFSNEDYLNTIQTFSKQNKNLSFYLLTVGTMALASCSNNVEKQQILPKIEIVESDSTHKQAIHTVKTKVDNRKYNKPRFTEPIILGDIELIDDEEPPKISDLIKVELMPEFKGGIDSLMIFINKELKYPDWERENHIEGQVLVTFTIDKVGKIQNPKILRSVEGSKNFDKEAIRILNTMPDWIPGKKDSENIDTEFSLPIIFKL